MPLLSAANGRRFSVEFCEVTNLKNLFLFFVNTCEHGRLRYPRVLSVERRAC